LESSTCCADTASEHAMMGHLMRATLRRWARAYRVDGFRFDLMGHHLRDNIERVRADLNALTLDADGLEGTEIYLYGEGWDFGGLAGGARGVNASQRHMAGTGVGTFNDRLRDAARGGGPFGGLRQQGFINGLYTDPNEDDTQDDGGRLAGLLARQDLLRVSLAGNLAAYRLTSASGRVVTGAEMGFNGQPAGYAASPLESVQYVSAHDNETLFDSVQSKAPLETPMDERVRMHNLGMSLVALGQGVPFFHAGDELLRSKSLDRDSYNSGDWFNRLDFSYQTNNWGAGLPPEEKNGANWPMMRMLLGRPELKPGPEHIQAALRHFEEMLRIRTSSPLFRLGSAAAVLAQMRFHNTGPGQIPGLIAMSLVDDPGAPVDPRYNLVVVLFNAAPQLVKFALPGLAGADLRLHPILVDSWDPDVRQARFEPSAGAFAIPGRTTAVFVSLKHS
jgi:pullulanase-type alpha-1,6-glucosidase